MPQTQPSTAPSQSGRIALAYGCSALMVVVCTGIARLMFPLFELANLAMVYLLGVVVISAWFGRGPSVFTTVAGVAAFDYWYVPPYNDLFNSELRYWVMFLVMLVVGVVIAT